MDIRALEAVIAVHEQGSFSSAAARLFVSQPALTRRVALLERELGVRLFVRGNNGAYVTRAGRALLEPAQRALRETASIRDTIGRMNAGEHGTLRIVATPDLSSRVPGDLIGRYHERFPGIDVRVVMARSQGAAVAAVESGIDDIALVDLPVDSETVSSAPLIEEDFFAVFAPGVTKADQSGEPPVVTRAMLQGRSVVQLPAEQCPSQAGSRLFDMLGVDPVSRIEVHSCDLLTPIIRSSRAVALLPRAAAFAARARGLDLAAPPRRITRTLGLVRHRSDASPAAAKFQSLALAAPPRGAGADHAGLA